MIFAFLMIILVGVVAFFHYTQGFFSATLSAILVVLSAALAMSLQEPVVSSLLQGRFGDTANALALVVLFALMYNVLRFIFDSAVPGNIQLPLIVDKVGAGIMGLIAGIFSVGVVAIAAQMLPFGPVIGGYARYDTVDSRSVILKGSGQSQDLYVLDELKADTLEKSGRRGLLLPVDDMLVGLVSSLSAPGGSLEGDRSFKSVHPDYVDELFADRLGTQPAAKRTALNVGGKQQVTVKGVYALDQVQQMEGEVPDLRANQRTGTAKSDAATVLLVVRTMFDKDATDKDNLFRFGTANTRLVVNEKMYYPIGTLENGNTLLLQKPDDPLMVEVTGDARGADLVFQVPRNEVLSGGAQGSATAPAEAKVARGVTLVVKRLARVDLGGKPVENGMPPASKEVAILRKAEFEKRMKPTETVVVAPLKLDKVQVSPQIFTKINVGTADASVKDQQLTSGTVSLQDKKFSKMNITPVDTLQKMRQGGYPVSELFVPEGKVAVQVQARPEGDDPWKWADEVAKFELVDAKKGKYAPAGVLAQIKQAQGLDKMVAQYNADGTVTSIGKEEGRPTDVWFVYLVPKGTQLTTWNYGGKKTADVNQTAE